MPEMPYPARQKREISGFAETGLCVCCILVWCWLLFFLLVLIFSCVSALTLPHLLIRW